MTLKTSDNDEALFRELVENESTKPIDTVVWEILWYRVSQATLDEVRKVLLFDLSLGRGPLFCVSNERDALRQFLAREHEPDRLMRMVAYDANTVLEDNTDAGARVFLQSLLAIYDEVLAAHSGEHS